MFRMTRNKKKRLTNYRLLAEIHPRLTINHSLLTNKAQVLLEYTIIIGIITLIFFAMNTLLKRGIQGMVKVVADQVGRQENADQRFDESGHMESSYAVTRSSLDKTTGELAGVKSYTYSDVIFTDTETVSNLGFINTE